MFSVTESNIGYVAGGAGVAGGAANYMRSRDMYNQHVPVLSYTQMLRMSMEEDGAENMGSSMNASREPYCNYLRGPAVEVKQERADEGYAENDYDFTCLTLGLGRPACDVTSSRVEPTNSNAVGSVASPHASRSSSGLTRTCTLCGTSKTPLWRSGPMGAKSLCNACGIRSKKAKKLAAAISSADFAEELQSGGNFSLKKSLTTLKQATTAGFKKAAKRKLIAKEEETEIPQQQQLVRKKRQLPAPLMCGSTSSPVKTESSCVTSPGTPSPCSTQRNPFASLALLSPSSASCNHMQEDVLFPKDEEQAAFLLMALSCGLVLAN